MSLLIQGKSCGIILTCLCGMQSWAKLMSLSVKFKAYWSTSSLLIESQLKSATNYWNKLKSPWLYNHSSRKKDFNSGILKVNITYTGQWYQTSCDKNGSLTPDSSTEWELLTNTRSIMEKDVSESRVGSFISCVKSYVLHRSVIFIRECWFSMFRFKSPVTTISSTPVSVARPIEFSISDSTTGEAVDGL